jgi:hypothetical protein
MQDDEVSEHLLLCMIGDMVGILPLLETMYYQLDLESSEVPLELHFHGFGESMPGHCHL